ncbi:MAG: type III-B CRISPR module RAMP protein Cmr6 [Pseudonocardiaceae bacterium]
MTVQAHGVLRPILHGEVAKLARDKVEDIPRRRLDGTATINPALLLHRLWLGDYSDGRDDALARALQAAHLRAVADACRNVPADLLDALHARRAAAAEALVTRHLRPTWTWCSVRIEPMWRLVVGHGEDSVHETSLTLSPTYGVPMLPGTALKGLAAAAARDEAGDAGWSEPDTTVFGSPRPGQSSQAHRGSVLIWDALPVSTPTLVLDVLTPHVKDYYDEGNSGGKTKDAPTTPPAEYHNPVPIRFLAVEKTPFRAYVLGPAPDVARCVGLLKHGLDEFGIGGKTAAGYGYCSASEEVPG